MRSLALGSLPTRAGLLSVPRHSSPWKRGRDVTCREFLELLLDFSDGKLPAGQAERCETHRAHCEICSGYFSAYRETRDLLEVAKGDRSIELPEELVRKILRSREKDSG